MEPRPAPSAWKWSCNCCGSGLHLPGYGWFRCPGCQRMFEVYWDARAGVPAATGASAEPLDALRPSQDSNCVAHPRSPAVTACDRCGDFICSACVRFIEGRHYCGTCFQGLHEQGGFRAETRRFPQWLAWTLGGAGCLVALLLVVLYALILTAGGR